MDAAAATTQRRLSALVVDDHPYKRELMAEILRRRGYVVRTAVDGQQGVEMFREQRCDLILLDFSMPRLNGIEALKRFRALDARVGIVMMASLGGEDVRDQAEGLGARFANEPFSLANVQEIFRQVELERTWWVEQAQVMSDNSQAPSQGREIDRRQHFRSCVDIEADMIHVANRADDRTCQIRDISLGGGRYQFNGKGPFPRGVQVELSFATRGSTDFLRLPASIVWTDPLGRRCGTRFQNLSREQQLLLEDIVAEAL